MVLLTDAAIALGTRPEGGGTHDTIMLNLAVLKHYESTLEGSGCDIDHDKVDMHEGGIAVMSISHDERMDIHRPIHDAMMCIANSRSRLATTPVAGIATHETPGDATRLAEVVALEATRITNITMYEATRLAETGGLQEQGPSARTRHIRTNLDFVYDTTDNDDIVAQHVHTTKNQTNQFTAANNRDRLRASATILSDHAA